MSMDAESYAKWKASVPLLYDWFAHHSLNWPTLTCRWGPVMHETNFRRKQRLAYAEQTDGSEPQMLTVASVDACKARAASGESIRSWEDSDKCPYIAIEREIMHPGEINRIRECPLYPEVLVTHTDAPDLYVWNVMRLSVREERQVNGKRMHLSDLILMGHRQNAEYALAASQIEPKIASGGRDGQVLVWNLEDEISSLVLQEDPGLHSNVPRLSAQMRLTGHEDTVEDLVFKPGSSSELVSVADDSKLLFWDMRSHTQPVASVAQAHGYRDLHCVDWSANGDLIATGSTDGVLKVWDRRRMTTPDACAFSFSFHKKAIMRVEWDPHNDGVLASGGEDSVLCIWDLFQSRVKSSEVQENKRARRSVPTELLFQHNGHRCIVVDFQWNPSDPWTLLSVSDDVALNGGGSSLQLWRVSDLIYRPEQEVLEELQQHARWVVSGRWENGDVERKIIPNGHAASEHPASEGDPDDGVRGTPENGTSVGP